MFKRFLKNTSRYLESPYWALGNDMLKYCPRLMSDKYYLTIRYRQLMRCNIDWKNPKTFSEKLQWLKMYDRRPVYTTMVDKYAAKKYISDKIGEEYVIPTLGIWKHFDEIDFDKLPEQFVLKCTHDSGSTIICKEKSSFDKISARDKLEKALGFNFYWQDREWPYKHVKPQIIAEPLLVDQVSPNLRDFKFYCFNGRPKIFYITSNKGTSLPVCQDFYDVFGTHLDIQDVNYKNNLVREPEKPNCMKKMLEISEILSKDTIHLRVDFYEIDSKIYVGELTFYESAGFCSFTPNNYNYKLGDWIELPKK